MESVRDPKKYFLYAGVAIGVMLILICGLHFYQKENNLSQDEISITNLGEIKSVDNQNYTRCSTEYYGEPVCDYDRDIANNTETRSIPFEAVKDIGNNMKVIVGVTADGAVYTFTDGYRNKVELESKGYFENRTFSEESLEFVDINYDGYLDLQIRTGHRGVDNYYNFYVYNKEIGNYSDVPALADITNISIATSTRSIYEYRYYEGTQGSIIKKYDLLGGDYILIGEVEKDIISGQAYDEEEYDVEQGIPLRYMCEIRENLDGMRVVKRVEFTLDQIKNVTDECDLKKQL